jgi:hypothetical protein
MQCIPMSLVIARNCRSSVEILVEIALDDVIDKKLTRGRIDNLIETYRNQDFIELTIQANYY